MKKVLKVILIIFCSILFIGLIASLFDTKSKKSNPKISNNTTVDTSSIKETKWTYDINEDRINDSKTYIAQIDANEQLDFQFPYDGGVTVSILLRKRNNVTDAMLTISKGQFMPNAMEDHNIKVKFDNEKAQIYSYTDPSDGSTTVAFISNAKKFISKLKKSKVVLIECEFFNEGLRTMQFETAGLKWEY